MANYEHYHCKLNYSTESYYSGIFNLELIFLWFLTWNFVFILLILKKVIIKAKTSMRSYYYKVAD